MNPERVRCRSRIHESGRPLSLAPVAVFLAFAASCRTAGPIDTISPAPEISGLFAADVSGGGGRTGNTGSLMPHFEVVRNGSARDALVLQAPIAIRAYLKGASQGAVFQCLSTPVFNVGDGMQLEVSVNEDGKWRMIYSRYYDPGRRLEDRAWIPLRIHLGLGPSTRGAELQIRVSGGAQGDLTADWLALSDMSLVEEQMRP